MIYLDHAANSPLIAPVVEAMEPWMQVGAGGNPSSSHIAGRKAREALEDARDLVAEKLGVAPLDVLFTSGATESNNIAIYGAVAHMSGSCGSQTLPTIAAMPLEHKSVSEPIRLLTASDSPVKRAELIPFEVFTIGSFAQLDALAAQDANTAEQQQEAQSTATAQQQVGRQTGEAQHQDGQAMAAAQQQDGRQTDAVQHQDGQVMAAAAQALAAIPLGQVKPDSIREVMATNPTFATLMAINSEIGVVQPVELMLDVADPSTWTHVDITQGLGKQDVTAMCQKATSTALSAHKVGGPIGAGVLTLKRDRSPLPVMAGGGQERGVRSGTIPVALAVGTAASVAHAVDSTKAFIAHATALRNEFEQAVSQLPGVMIPTIGATRSPSISAVLMRHIDPGSLMLMLDKAGVCVSLGSACQSGAMQRSSVLTALQMPEDYVAVRVSLGEQTTKQDIHQAIAALQDAHKQLYTIG